MVETGAPVQLAEGLVQLSCCNRTVVTDARGRGGGKASKGAKSNV